MRNTLKYLNITSVTLFATVMNLSFLGGCSSERYQRPDTEQQKAVMQAYTSGLDALMQEPILNPDVIWVLIQVEKISPNETLRQFIEEKVATVPDHPALCAIIPDAPRVELPKQLPSGFDRYRECLLAPFGVPPERAISFIKAFLSTDERGYVLTHQFIVLIWAEQMGLELSDRLSGKKNDLLKRIYIEQREDAFFSDLYAERAALLLYYGKPKTKDAVKWIDTIINAQLSDGIWESGPNLIDYDGQAVSLSLPKQHTTVLSLWAIRAFLSLY
jgi:hypothetical protein